MGTRAAEGRTACTPAYIHAYIHSHGRNGHGSVGVGREDTGTGVSRATGLGKKARHPEKGSSSTQNQYICLESVPSTAPSLICHSLNV